MAPGPRPYFPILGCLTVRSWALIPSPGPWSRALVPWSQGCGPLLLVPWSQGPRTSVPGPWSIGPELSALVPLSGDLVPRSQSRGPLLPVPWSQGSGPLVPEPWALGHSALGPWSTGPMIPGPGPLVLGPDPWVRSSLVASGTPSSPGRVALTMRVAL